MMKRNVVTGDETRVHCIEPVRKVSNKTWATKNIKRPVIAKRTLCKKGFICNLLSIEGVAIQAPAKKDKSVTGQMMY